MQFVSPKIQIAILVRKDYWNPQSSQFATIGNGPSHRSVPDIIAAIERAGAQAKVVEHGDEVGPFHGLVLPGGQDIHPHHYGQAIQAGVSRETLDFDFDSFQIEWTKKAIQQQAPILGICRGMQLINIATGGTLHQDIQGHAHQRVLDDPRLRGETTHTIRSHRHSQIGRLLGATSLAVNSIHHQSVDRLGAGLQVSSWSEDGTLEALEGTNGQSIFGVQFHPEDLSGRGPFQNLFDKLVEAVAQKA